MKEHPILFNEPMVRAILGGIKTQSRRIIKPQPIQTKAGWKWEGTRPKATKGNGTIATMGLNSLNALLTALMRSCPYGAIGDRLWVRETFAIHPFLNPPYCWDGPYLYRATDGNQKEEKISWRPSIHMPRSASRIILQITDLRIERLNDISAADAIAEGIEPIIGPDNETYYGNYGKEDIGHLLHPIESYRSLWESINGPDSWIDNPYVWVIDFTPLN